jgi:hypothetical protein
VRNISGDVALNGTVPSYPQYLEAAIAAPRVAGVNHVHNHLSVELPTGDADPGDVTALVQDALGTATR